MTTEQTDEVAKIGDIIIDPESGEILEMPEGVGDPIEWLTHKTNEAQRAGKAWEAVTGMYKAALGELLNKAGVKSMRTQYGAPGWRSRPNRKVRVDRLPDVIKDYELTRAHVEALLLCAPGLRVKEVEDLELPDGVKEKLIEEGMPTAYVQITPATPMPPDVEKVKRPSS
jgi:hypothetical protein